MSKIRFKQFKKDYILAKGFSSIELTYSWYGGKLTSFGLVDSGYWFCRFWNETSIVGESYGKTKFEAYRKAKESVDRRFDWQLYKWKRYKLTGDFTTPMKDIVKR